MTRMVSPLSVCRRIVILPLAFSRVKRRHLPAVRSAFGRALRHWRLERGMSQERLAEEAGIHRTYAGDVERGARNVSIDNMFRIAQGLGMPLSDLIKTAERELRKAR